MDAKAAMSVEELGDYLDPCMRITQAGVFRLVDGGSDAVDIARALAAEVERLRAIKARALVIARNEGLSVVQRHAARIILYGMPDRGING